MEYLIICAPSSVWASLECCPGITCAGTSINWNKFGWTVFQQDYSACTTDCEEIWENLVMLIDASAAHLSPSSLDQMWKCEPYLHSYPNVIWRCSIKWKIGRLCEGEPKMWLYGDRECRLLQIIQMGHLACCNVHTCYLSFPLHGQGFWIPNFTQMINTLKNTFSKYTKNYTKNTLKSKLKYF